MLRDVTVDEIYDSVKKNKITKISLNECSICKKSTCYVVKGNYVFFDPTCGCCTCELEPRSWRNVAHYVNMQIVDNVKLKWAKKLGIDLRIAK